MSPRPVSPRPANRQPERQQPEVEQPKEEEDKPWVRRPFDPVRESYKVVKSQYQCRNTKTQVNPSSALNTTKHHQSNPSIVPGILDSNLSRRACMHSSKFLITWSNRITSYNRIRFFNRFPSFRFYYFPGLLNLCCTRQRGLPLLFREAGFTAPSGTYSGRRPTIRDLNLHTLIYF